MARIPQYEQRNVIGGVQSAPTASSNVRADDPMASAVGNLGNALVNVANVLVREDVQKKEDIAAVQVANIISDGRSYWQEDNAKRMNAWKMGDEDLRIGLEKDFDKWAQDQESKLPTDASRNYFKKHMAEMRAGMLTNAYTFMDKSTTQTLNLQTLDGINTDVSAVTANPDARNTVAASRIGAMMARTDIGEAEKQKAVHEYLQKLDVARQTGLIQRDPLAWYKSTYGDLPESLGGKAPSGAATPAQAIANAIYGQESSSGKADTSKVNSQNVTGPMQMMETTFNGMKKLGLIPESADWRNPTDNKNAGFKWVEYLSQKYNGDPEKVAAAYYAGEKAVNADGTINRHWGNKTRPQDPTVGQYVDQVVGRIKKQGGLPEKAGSDAAFSALPMNVQMQLKQQSEQAMNQQVARIFSNASVAAATAAVAGQNIGVSDQVNTDVATAQAIEAVQRQLPVPMTDVQRQQVVMQVNQQARIREAQRKDEQGRTVSSFADTLDQNGGNLQAAIASNPQGYASLPRDQKDWMNKYAGEVATGGTRQTNWQVYAELTGNPKGLAGVNLEALKYQLGRDQYDQLRRMQQQSLKEQQEGKKDTFMGDKDAVKQYMAANKISLSDAEEAKLFSAIEQDWQNTQAMSGKKFLTVDERNRVIANNLTKYVTQRGFLWDSKQYGYQITEVPAAEQAQITAALMLKGIPVTSANVLRYYRQGLELVDKKKVAAPAAPTAKASPPKTYGQDTGILPIQ